MFKFFLTIFLIGFALVSLLGFSVVRSFKQMFFGSPKSKNKQRSSSSNQQRTRSSATNKQVSRKKVITEDEGEYVDYEEVK